MRLVIVRPTLPVFQRLPLLRFASKTGWHRASSRHHASRVMSLLERHEREPRSTALSTVASTQTSRKYSSNNPQRDKQALIDVIRAARLDIECSVAEFSKPGANPWSSSDRSRPIRVAVRQEDEHFSLALLRKSDTRPNLLIHYRSLFGDPTERARYCCVSGRASSKVGPAPENFCHPLRLRA